MEVVSDIHANHSSMTKFESLQDPGFIGVCRGLQRFIPDRQSIKENRESK